MAIKINVTFSSSHLHLDLYLFREHACAWNENSLLQEEHVVKAVVLERL